MRHVTAGGGGGACLWVWYVGHAGLGFAGGLDDRFGLDVDDLAGFVGLKAVGARRGGDAPG